MHNGTTITQFIIEEQRRVAGATGDFTSLLNDVVTAGKVISNMVNHGALVGVLGSAGSENGQGETQKKLDILSNEPFIKSNIQIPAETREFAINVSNMRFWEPPVRRYVNECLAGREGIRGEDFNMRWIASMVAEVHRILTRGGVFMYPMDGKMESKGLGGKLRLLYEANPMSFIIEQAGGLSVTGKEHILDLQPEDLHQRVPVILGSRAEVERIQGYHLAG